MTKTDTPLRARVREAGFTPAAVATALNLQIDINRILDGAESGSSYEKVVAYLDRIERDGSYMAPVAPVDLRTKDERYAAAQAAADAAFNAPRLAAQEAQARLDAWRAEEREKVLQARAIATAKYVSDQMDRISLGMALRDIREEAGLGLNEVAALIGTVDASQLDRLERGKPLGVRDLDAIKSIYRALPKFTGKRKVASN
jgi:Helix-turn-helix domain